MRASLLLFVVVIGCSSEEAPTSVSDASTDGTAAGDATATETTAADTTATETTATETTADVAPDTRDAGSAGDAACKLVKKYSTQDVACNACAQTECCAEVNACLGDTRCDDDYVNCILACSLLPDDAGDAAAEHARCLGQCATQHPAGKTAYDAAIGCVTAKCSECD